MEARDSLKFSVDDNKLRSYSYEVTVQLYLDQAI